MRPRSYQWKHRPGKHLVHRRPAFRAAVEAMEGRLLLSGPTFDLSKDVWDVPNDDVTISVTSTPISHKDPKTGKTVTTGADFHISVVNKSPIAFKGANLNAVRVVFKDGLPSGVTLDNTDPAEGLTNTKLPYALIEGSFIVGSTTSDDFVLNGNVPMGYKPNLEAYIKWTPPKAAPSPKPPFGDALRLVDLTKFDAAFQADAKPLGLKLDATALSNINQLVTFIDHDPSILDLRWAAYMLATDYAENGVNDFAPGEESVASYSKGAYGKPVVSPDGSSQIYFGRGYAGLTWAYQYARFGSYLNDQGLLASDADLLNTPSYAETPSIAYAIMSYGMRSGTITQVASLRTYINASETDYVDARRIINPLDPNAQTVANVAKAFEAALRSSMIQPQVSYKFLLTTSGAVPSLAGTPSLGVLPMGSSLPQYDVVGTFTDHSTGATFTASFLVTPTASSAGLLAPTTSSILDANGDVFKKFTRGHESYSLTISSSVDPTTVYQSLAGTF